MLKAEQRLPRTFMQAVKYQLVLEAYETEWVAFYQWGNSRFADVTAHGDSIEDALNEMLRIFAEYEAFENLRHLLRNMEEK
jgi:hypothetical protein